MLKKNLLFVFIFNSHTANERSSCRRATAAAVLYTTDQRALVNHTTNKPVNRVYCAGLIWLHPAACVVYFFADSLLFFLCPDESFLLTLTDKVCAQRKQNKKLILNVKMQVSQDSSCLQENAWGNRQYILACN